MGFPMPGGKQRWKDLTASQRALLVAATVVQLTLLVIAQKDLGDRTADGLRGPKLLWRMAVLVNFVGPIAYFVFGIRRNRAAI